MDRFTPLRVEFVGEEHVVSAPARLTFGRRGDIELDTCESLQPTVGAFVRHRGMWWVRNEDVYVDLRVLDRESRSSTLIAPGSAAPIPFRRSVVRIEAGRANYELGVFIDGEWDDWTLGEPIPRSEVSLNREQRQLLALLAESRLLGAGNSDIPTNAEVAERLGWKLTKLNRKLDHLCVKFEKLGVRGLRGSADRLAVSRRRKLVDHCVISGLITVADLETIRLDTARTSAALATR